MNNILSDLYHGNYAGNNRPYHPKSAYGRAFSKLADLETELLRCLPEDAKAMYEKVGAAWGEMVSLTGEWGFETGFRLGAQIMIASGEPDFNLLPVEEDQ